MAPDFSNPKASPFEAARSMSSPVPAGAEIHDWSEEMAAVRSRRDRDSFIRIYDHFMPKVCLYLRNLGSSQAVAEELGQEAFIRLWQRADLFDPARGSLYTWLFRIARNLHIDLVRKNPGWQQVQDELDQALEAEDSPRYSSAEDHTEYVQLKRRIDALSTVQARLMRMSYFEAKTHQEIAVELDMPLGTVKSHLRRAFLKLQTQVRGAR